MSKRPDADSHYRAVCRALVLETLELSSFLEKVSQGTKELRTDRENPSTELDQLQFTDWVSDGVGRADDPRRPLVWLVPPGSPPS